MKQQGLFSSVAARVTVTLLVVTTVLLSGMAGMLFKRAHDKAEHSYEGRLEIAASTLRLSFALPLKSGDEKMVESIAINTMQTDLIYAISLETASGNYYFLRNPKGNVERVDSPVIPGSGLMEEARPVMLEDELLGTLTVFMMPEFAGQSLQRWVLVTIISIVLIDLLVVFVVYATLWILVLYPLSLLKEHAQAIKNDASEIRQPSGIPLYGEFRVVSDTIDEIAKNLKTQIVEVEKANKQFDRASRKFPIPVGIYDSESRQVLFVNDKFIQFFGYEPEDIPTVDDFDERVYPDAEYRAESRKIWEERWAKAFETGTPMYPFERIMRSKGGQEKIVELSGVIFDKRLTLGIFNDLTDRKLAEEEVQVQQNRLRKLTAHVQEVREEERKRIAQELHDELGQILTVAKIDLANLEQSLALESREVTDSVNKLVATIDQASDTARQISENLRPGMLDLLGLGPALQLHINRFQQSTQIQVDLVLEGQGEDNSEFDVDDRVATTAFRIVQEALTNVARYAQATHVSIHVVMLARELVIVVRDDGVGFDLEEQQSRGSFGLLGMRERAAALSGDLIIEASPGQGVRIEANLPIKEDELS